jgi:hypothetical protein
MNARSTRMYGVRNGGGYREKGRWEMQKIALHEHTRAKNSYLDVYATPTLLTLHLQRTLSPRSHTLLQEILLLFSETVSRFMSRCTL